MKETIVVCRLQHQLFGINIQHIESIETVSTITPLPNAPEYMNGIMPLRGEIIPVIKLNVLFGIGKTEINNQTKIVVIKIKGYRLGLIVDDTLEMIDATQEKMTNDFHLNINKQMFFEGVTYYEGNLILLIQIESLFQAEDLHLIGELLTKAE